MTAWNYKTDDCSGDMLEQIQYGNDTLDTDSNYEMLGVSSDGKKGMGQPSQRSSDRCWHLLPCGLCKFYNAPCPYAPNEMSITFTATTTLSAGDDCRTYTTQTDNTEDDECTK